MFIYSTFCNRNSARLERHGWGGAFPSAALLGFGDAPSGAGGGPGGSRGEERPPDGAGGSCVGGRALCRRCVGAVAVLWRRSGSGTRYCGGGRGAGGASPVERVVLAGVRAPARFLPGSGLLPGGQRARCVTDRLARPAVLLQGVCPGVIPQLVSCSRDRVGREGGHGGGLFVFGSGTISGEAEKKLLFGVQVLQSLGVLCLSPRPDTPPSSGGRILDAWPEPQWKPPAGEQLQS